MCRRSSKCRVVRFGPGHLLHEVSGVAAESGREAELGVRKWRGSQRRPPPGPPCGAASSACPQPTGPRLRAPLGPGGFQRRRAGPQQAQQPATPAAQLLHLVPVVLLLLFTFLQMPSAPVGLLCDWHLCIGSFWELCSMQCTCRICLFH